MIEELLKVKALARGSSSSSTDLEGEPAPRLGSPQPIDEAKTPQPDTTPKAPPRHLEGLEVASTSEHTATRNSNAPLSLPAFPPLAPPNGASGLVDIRPASLPSSQTPSGSRQPQPPSAPAGSGGNPRKRSRDTSEGPGPSFTFVPKRARLDIPLEAVEEDPASFQGTRWGGEAVRGGSTTPPNRLPAGTPSTPAIFSRPDYPFIRGSPSPQQRQPPRTPVTKSLRHRVPSPTRRPEATASSTQLITPLGEEIPHATMAAVWARGNDARRTPEPSSSRAGPSHMVASGTLALASAVQRQSAGRGVFNPPSSSTPARPSYLTRTPAVTSRPARGAWLYERPAPPSPSPPLSAIPAIGPATEGHDSGGSQETSSTDSSGAAGANQASAPDPVDTVTEPPTPNRAIPRPGHGMPPIPGAHPLGALDPNRFTGAIYSRRGRANTETPTTPDSSVRGVAPETPMASPTRYGTEINPSMRHLY
jgi:hypothetical protein